MTANHLKNDAVLSSIVNELKTVHNCHTIILYGSRARGDFNQNSDYDVIGIAKICKKQHLAQYDQRFHIYKDIFVVPDSEFDEINDEYLRLSDGICLWDSKEFGKSLLTKINIMLRKPFVLDDDEINTRRAWYGKMLNRAKVQDVEGKYRSIWIVHTLLEDYFAFRNMHYLGPKKGIKYLQDNDPDTFMLFDNILNDCNNLQVLNNAINHIINNHQ